MKYLKHLRGNKCDRLFQRPSTKPNALRWYDSQPMGHNTIGNLMSKLSEKAGLAVLYTNHSLRATSVHILDNVGNFAGRHIMTITGHKSETSLKTYTGYTGESIKRKMSDTLSDSLRVAHVPDKQQKTVSIASNLELRPLTNNEFSDLLDDLNNDDFDNFLSSMPVEIPVENKENVVEKMSCKNVNYMYTASERPQMPFPIFNNCSNITINYNMK